MRDGREKWGFHDSGEVMDLLAASTDRGPAFRREAAFTGFNKSFQSFAAKTAEAAYPHALNVPLGNPFIERAKGDGEKRGGLRAVE